MADYHRKYFGLRKEVAPVLESTYASRLVDLLRSRGYQITRGGLTVRLAQQFGFCVGVERAVQMAYEARQKFPGKRIFITAEIIHNAFVNKKLVEMGFIFLKGPYASGMSYDDITADDVVILPAFGAPVSEIRKIQEKGAFIVDTTCGAVINVWNNVQKYAREGFTSVIHGKYSHEETQATSSRAMGLDDSDAAPPASLGGKYLVVRDLEEAKVLCDYIERGGDRQEFLRRFALAVSPDFDPDRDLERVGLANQTTMLSSESLALQDMLHRSFLRKYGDQETCRRFRSFDTICSATQERQDAVTGMMGTPPDLMIVIGGYNSSNTTHLAEIPLERHVPAYHIDDADCLINREQIRHQPIGQAQELIARDWWPHKSPLVIGVTAGASTPNNKTGDVILRLFDLAGADVSDLLQEVAPPANSARA